MSAKTGIQWTDATWNPVRGCTRVSEGCRHCYAESIASRFSGRGGAFEFFADRYQPGSKWTGRVELIPEMLEIPLHWRKPRRIFVNSMSDLFHENLPDKAIDHVFAVMALCPQHTFQVLTKRDERLLDYFADTLFRQEMIGIQAEHVSGIDRFVRGSDEVTGSADDILPRWWLPLPNVWLGVSVEDSAHRDRIDLLRSTPAALRFLSLEPLLGDLGELDLRGISWVIAGAESGPGARPMDIAWVRSIKNQCVAAGIPFFFKQDARAGHKIPTPVLDGRQWMEFPHALGDVNP
jgi:protein gp37